MKKLRNLLALLLVLALALAMVACSSSDDTTTADAGDAADTTADAAADTTDTTDAEPAAAEDETPADETTDATAAADATYTVGICQLVEHPALDNATQGFKDALTEKLGDAVSFEEGNASGESANCTTIVNGFLASNVDLIMANATASLQAAASATSTIPVIGTSITDYASALGIDNWTGVVGTNVSGATDLAPLDEQAAMINELFPDAQTIGLLYCSAEANSVYQVDTIEGYLTTYGYEVKKYAFTDTNDVTSVTQSACDSCDVIYIPTDNTAASNTEAIANVVLAEKVPVVAGEEGICSGCGVATLSISYYDMGYIAGEMAYEILVNGADVSTMAIKSAPDVVKEYNAANCEALGITIPDGYTAIED
jgi:putative ABC transport system substrate-binding protein